MLNFAVQLLTLFSPLVSGQFEIEKSCELLFQMAESVDYDYDVQDTTLDGLLILPCYGSMTTGNYSLEKKI